jgi:hypothetical protein
LNGGFDGCPDGWGDEVPCAGARLVLCGEEGREGEKGMRVEIKGRIGNE